MFVKMSQFYETINETFNSLYSLNLLHSGPEIQGKRTTRSLLETLYYCGILNHENSSLLTWPKTEYFSFLKHTKEEPFAIVVAESPNNSTVRVFVD